MTAPVYLDPRTSRTYPLDPPRWCGDDRAPLLVAPLPGIDRGAVRSEVPSLWRYAAALPFAPDAPITLGEGRTPLVARAAGGRTVLLKCEWMMPTGSFKDRGASVMLSLLRAQGIRRVLEDSSGNGGASIATYAAAGGLAAKILVPASTSPAKIVQARAAGAEIELVPGARQDTTDEALRQAERVFYASHAWHPFFLEGTKTLAYELWEDLGFRAPDVVVAPCGGGSNVLGCGIGFDELRRAGAIDAVPRIYAAQPAACAPIARAWLGAAPADPAPTIAEGTAIAQPIRLPEVVDVLRRTGGGALMLEEDEIAHATLALARTGVYVEPTSAQAFAALERLVTRGDVPRDATCVVVLTGSGLKATARIAELVGP